MEGDYGHSLRSRVVAILLATDGQSGLRSCIEACGRCGRRGGRSDWVSHKFLSPFYESPPLSITIRTDHDGEQHSSCNFSVERLSGSDMKIYVVWT